MLLTTGASAGLDIYKQEVGCDDITPDLQDNVDLINEKQTELVEMKDNINLRWVPGKNHSVKSVRTRSFSGPDFPAFGLTTEIYSVNLRIQSKCGKIRTRKTPKTDTFHALNLSMPVEIKLKFEYK